MSPRCRIALMLIPLTALLLSTPAAAMHLQEAYEQAGPGEGYDKLVILNPNEVYTGFMVVDIGTSCAIHGNGALISLDPAGTIKVGQSVPSQTKLDIDGCVITGGACGINYEWSSDSRVENCTIVGNGMGIRMWGTYGAIENCIITGNYEYGIACRDNMYPSISYNCMWGNLGGDHMKYCFS